jgi:hypothetical protein
VEVKVEVFSTNHLQQGEAKVEWHIIQLVRQRQPLKDTKCFREGELHECQHWRAIREIHHLEGNWALLLERLLELQQDTQLDEGGTMINHRPMSSEIALSRIVQEGYYDPHQLGDETDLFQVIQYLEAKTPNLHIPVAVEICRLRKVWQANSPSSYHFSRITIPKTKSTLETKLRLCGHISHERRTSLPWSVVIC